MDKGGVTELLSKLLNFKKLKLSGYLIQSLCSLIVVSELKTFKRRLTKKLKKDNKFFLNNKLL